MSPAPDHMVLTADGPRLVGFRTRTEPPTALESLTLTFDGGGPANVVVRFSNGTTEEYEPHGSLVLDLYRVESAEPILTDATLRTASEVENTVRHAMVKPTQPTPSREWMSLPEVSEEYGIAKQTLYYWRHQGSGPPSHKVGRRVKYRRSEVEAWMEEQGT